MIHTQKTYSYESDYERSEMIGRWALQDLFSINPSLFKNPLSHNPDKFGAYDSYYMVYDEQSLAIKKRVLIEIKCRDKIFDKYILEHDKYKRLISLRKSLYYTPEECQLIYVNFTPAQTIFWDLDKVDLGKKESLSCNRATVVSKTDKKNKSVYYLSPEQGLQMSYVYQPSELEQRYYTHDYLVPKVEKVVETREWRGLNHLFDDVEE